MKTLEELANQITGAPTENSRGAIVDLNFYNKAILSALRAAEQRGIERAAKTVISEPLLAVDSPNGMLIYRRKTQEELAAAIPSLAQGGE